MSDTTKQERIEEFMRKSLLGEEVINTQFHLFSARSSVSGRVVEPRVLCANNDLLAKSSKYFLDLLSSDVDPSDTSMFDLFDENEVPNDLRIDDYGYGSDSDLDEYPTSSKVNTESHSKGDTELFEGGIGSVDGFVTSSPQTGMDELLSVTKDGAESVESDETAVQETPGSKRLGKDAAVRLRSLSSRHILIKDTAFQTWYTLLNYLYTGKITVLPLSSSTGGRKSHECSTSSLDKPRCSAKSMYRLACKTGLDDLRNKTFSFIRSHLTEQNILKELSSRLGSKHPELLEMELDILYSHIASPAVVAGFPAFARRIANGELPHGAEIIVGIHTRVLKEPHSVPLKLAPIPSLTVQVPSNSAESAKMAEDGANAYYADKQGVATATTASQPTESNGPTSAPSSAPASTPDITPSSTTPVPTATSTKLKAKAPRVSLPTTNFASASTAASPSAPAPISSTVTSKPPPAPASVSSATPPLLGSRSAQSFGKPASAPTSSSTSSFLSSNVAPSHAPNAAAPPLFGLGGATAPAFGSSSTPTATSSSTRSAFSPESTEAFVARFAAALAESSSLRAPTSGTTFFGSGQATGDAESRRLPTFSFAQRDDTTESQKKPAVNPFTFGPPPPPS
ncbi:hypothetical protein JVU11DRAFT_10093 [Chiua virens]|nr:hypothetical protein JVU11DRAFT_10093 [Chiua virens]